MTTPSVPDVIKAYIRLRDALDMKRKAAKREEAELAEQMTKLEGFLRQQLHDMGVDSIKSQHGTVFQTTKTSVGVSDWEATLTYIKENDAFHFLNRAVNKDAVTEYVSEHHIPPPGVRVDTTHEISIRRSAA